MDSTPEYPLNWLLTAALTAVISQNLSVLPDIWRLDWQLYKYVLYYIQMCLHVSECICVSIYCSLCGRLSEAKQQLVVSNIY